jgi:hypothetical protein
MLNSPADAALSLLLVSLMKSAVSRDTDALLWQTLVDRQSRVRDYVSVIGLELLIDETEGHAYLRQRDRDTSEDDLPRLIARRQLSYPVSLLLVLLRKQLVEFDAGSSDERLILDRAQISDMIRLFLPAATNEVRLLERIEANIEKVVELGFLRRLRGSDDRYEVRRILKTFVDAQWLNEFSEKLQAYRSFAAQDDAVSGVPE